MLLILCPYCCSPLDDDVEQRRLAAWKARASSSRVPCNTCGGDVTRDAPIDSSREAYTRDMTAACVFCTAPRHALAVRCARCRRWQNPNSVEQRTENGAIDAQEK